MKGSPVKKKPLISRDDQMRDDAALQAVCAAEAAIEAAPGATVDTDTFAENLEATNLATAAAAVRIARILLAGKYGRAASPGLCLEAAVAGLTASLNSLASICPDPGMAAHVERSALNLDHALPEDPEDDDELSGCFDDYFGEDMGEKERA